MMSTMAMASSSLNPNAPMFIPAAFRRVEDYSPEWWELVKTTAWFRDHWFHQHQLYEDLADDVDDVAALLPDDSVDLLDTDDLFYTPPQPDLLHHKPVGTVQHTYYSPSPTPRASHLNTGDNSSELTSTRDHFISGFGGDMDAVLKTLSLNSPRGGGAVARALRDPQPRHGEKPAHYVGAAKGSGARRAIHQPR